MKPPRSAPLAPQGPTAGPLAPLTPTLPGVSSLTALPGLAGHGQASVLALRQAFSAPEPREEKGTRTQGARTQRRRLWQLPPKFHCPVVGVCFTVEELRPWVVKMLGLPPASSDYELHVGAVGACASRTPFAEALQRRLEKRYATQLRRFAQARGRAGVLALWRDAVLSGLEIPGAMWAAWTHPACDESLEQDIFRDIHMIQHQVGNATRADRAALDAARAENAALRNALDETRQALDSLRQSRSAEQRLNAQTVAELRARIVAREARLVRLEAEHRAARQQRPDPQRAARMGDRLRMADGRIAALADRVEQLERALILARRESSAPRAATVTPECPGRCATADADAPPVALDGKCVLCVGGRTGLVDSYKEVVLQRGGRFLHHDGGIEDNLQRIDAALAAADLVICQAGCISHNAYWRVKEQCKRSGKKCVYIKTPGTASFGRALDTVDVEAGRQ